MYEGLLDLDSINGTTIVALLPGKIFLSRLTISLIIIFDGKT